MSCSISRDQARAFRSRWRLVREMEQRELRETPPEVKFRQLEALMSLREGLGSVRHANDKELRVEDRWNRLRKILGV